MCYFVNRQVLEEAQTMHMGPSEQNSLLFLCCLLFITLGSTVYATKVGIFKEAKEIKDPNVIS